MENCFVKRDEFVAYHYYFILAFSYSFELFSTQNACTELRDKFCYRSVGQKGTYKCQVYKVRRDSRLEFKSRINGSSCYFIRLVVLTVGLSFLKVKFKVSIKNNSYIQTCSLIGINSFQRGFLKSVYKVVF